MHTYRKTRCVPSEALKGGLSLRPGCTSFVFCAFVEKDTPNFYDAVGHVRLETEGDPSALVNTP